MISIDLKYDLHKTISTVLYITYNNMRITIYNKYVCILFYPIE